MAPQSRDAFAKTTSNSSGDTQAYHHSQKELLTLSGSADVADNISRTRFPPQREGLLLRLHRHRIDSAFTYRAGKIRLRATQADLRGKFVALPQSISVHDQHPTSGW